MDLIRRRLVAFRHPIRPQATPQVHRRSDEHQSASSHGPPSPSCNSKPVDALRTDSSKPDFISSLPDELFCEIFLLVVYSNIPSHFPYPSPTFFGSRYSSGDSRDAIPLGMVCKRWLHLTRTHSGLWTTIDLDDLTDTRGLALLSACLRYCKPATPMIVRLRLTQRRLDPAITQRALALIATHQTRWEEISIRINYANYDLGDILAPLKFLDPFSMTALQRWGIHRSQQADEIRTVDDAISTEILRHCPSLKAAYASNLTMNFVIHRDFQSEDENSASPMTKRLTQLGLAHLDPWHIRCILFSFPRLEVLHIVKVWEPEVAFHDSIPMPHLRVLSVPAYDWPAFPIIPGPTFDRLELTSFHECADDVRIPTRLYDADISVRMLVLDRVRDETWVEWLFEWKPLKDVEIVLFTQPAKVGAG
ncbi:uncharacterized protein SCHCODRAFT_02554227 [Schizophyllum commune H4-8]|uniref:Uncharacterized protein n=1 Tax=Schizophyllum commune (strain H4-8 / FGSC 9210) TaxID=578458 RepID=D8QH29_SCHCM